MTKIIILTFLPLLLLSSCKKDDKKTNAEKIVTEWVGKTVVFPADIMCTSAGRDTICPDLSATPYKVLVYTDSVGCTSCKLQMYKWTALIEEAVAEMEGQLSFHFYFHPKDKKELMFLLKRDNFKYPVLFDEEDKLNKRNKFPSDMSFQCFLLDKDNKVALIGNPVLNPAIWELYKQVVTGEKSETKTVENTSVEVERNEIELQHLKAGKTTKTVFILKNTGSSPLVIQNVSTSCGCTVPQWEKKPIEPGSKTEIEVKVTPKSSGYMRETITVSCNTEEKQLSLTVRGTADE